VTHSIKANQQYKQYWLQIAQIYDTYVFMHIINNTLIRNWSLQHLSVVWPCKKQCIRHFYIKVLHGYNSFMRHIWMYICIYIYLYLFRFYCIVVHFVIEIIILYNGLLVEHKKSAALKNCAPAQYNNLGIPNQLQVQKC